MRPPEENLRREVDARAALLAHWLTDEVCCEFGIGRNLASKIRRDLPIPDHRGHGRKLRSEAVALARQLRDPRAAARQLDLPEGMVWVWCQRSVSTAEWATWGLQRPSGLPTDEERLARARQLLRDGVCASRVADRTKLTTHAVHALQREMGMPVSRPGTRFAGERRERAVALLRQGMPIYQVAREVRACREQLSALRVELGLPQARTQSAKPPALSAPAAPILDRGARLVLLRQRWAVLAGAHG